MISSILMLEKDPHGVRRRPDPMLSATFHEEMGPVKLLTLLT